METPAEAAPVATKSNTRALISILLTVFIDLVGIGIIIPIISPLILKNSDGLLGPEATDQFKNILLGLVLGVYPLGQFFGAPLLGALADRKGRRIVLLLSIAGAAIGYTFFGIAIELNLLWLMFAARIFQGFMGGNVSVAFATISDISAPQDRAKAFGLVGAAFGLGFVIGPFLGGKLSDPEIYSFFNNSTPFWISAILALVNALLVYLFLPETSKTFRQTPITLFTGIKNVAKAFQMQNLRTVFAIGFLTTLGFSFFTSFIQVYLIRKFDFGIKDVANVFATVGIWTMITQGGLLRLVKNRSPFEVLRISLFTMACGIPLLTTPTDSFYIFCLIPITSISSGFTNPNLSSAVSQLARPDEQGEVFGINQSLQALGFAIPPMIGGALANVDIRFPLYAAGVVVFCAWVLVMYKFGRASQVARAGVQG